KETEYLAARSLSETAGKQKAFPRALELAQQAQAANPKDTRPVIGLHIRLGQWQEGLHALRKAARHGYIARAKRRRLEGVLHLQQGTLLLAEAHADTARLAARAALKQLPDFAPAILLYARALDAAGRRKQAIALLLAAWKKS